MEINGKKAGAGRPVYIVAELSANHGGSFDHAAETIRAAAAGADAIKVQRIQRGKAATKEFIRRFIPLRAG